MRKRRLSASVDVDLLEFAEDAAAHGAADNVSAWVNEAMRLKVEHDRRLANLAAFIEDYEAEHGVITESDMAAAQRWARSRAIPVRAAAERPTQPYGKD
jgi:hypothetical protein